MHEKRRLPHSGRTFKVGVEGRTVRLEPATLRSYENDRSRTSREVDDRSITSREIDDRLRTSRMIPTTSRRNGETRQPEFRVHLVERAWIQKDVGMHAAQVVRRCLTK